MSQSMMLRRFSACNSPQSYSNRIPIAHQLTPAKSHSTTGAGVFSFRGNGALEELPLNLWNIKEQSSLPEPCVRSHCRFGRCLRKASVPHVSPAALPSGVQDPSSHCRPPPIPSSLGPACPDRRARKPSRGLVLSTYLIDEKCKHPAPSPPQNVPK